MATITAAAVAAADTVTVGSTTLTARAQRAFGTLTFASAIATDTFIVAGVTFTIYASGTTLNAAQNPAGVVVGASDTLMAAAAMDAIHAHPVTGPLVRCSYAAGVLTVVAVGTGITGNDYSLVGGDRITASGATFSDGTAVDPAEFNITFPGATAAINALVASAIATKLSAAGYTASSSAAIVTVTNTDGTEPAVSSSNGTRLAVGSRFFVSTEQTGTGAEQTVAHGLSAAPSRVLVSLTEEADAAVDIAEGTHTSANVVLTVTSGAKFKVAAWV